MLRTLSLALAALTACSAPALLPELAAAESSEKAGDLEAALGEYERAQSTCLEIGDERVRRDSCASAYLGRAELLHRMDRKRQAAKAYGEIPRVLSEHVPASAEASYRAGRIYLELGEDKAAYAWLWATVTSYPNEAFASDALRIVVRDGRKRNVRELKNALEGLLGALSHSDVADNILFILAELKENEFNDKPGALAHYDQIASRYSADGLADDSLWHGARLAHAAGDFRGAERRLRALLKTRELALGAGSYFSVWLDDAHLRLGVLLRVDLKNYREAAEVLSELGDDYPASILRDDAQYELALVYRDMKQKAKACRALDQLVHQWPDSKFASKAARELRPTLSCPR